MIKVYSDMETPCKLLSVHPAERAVTSDWSVNSFILVVYEKIYVRFSQNVLSKVQPKEISQRQS